MIVTADAGSHYDPHPVLSLEWDPDRPVHVQEEILAHDPTVVPQPVSHPTFQSSTSKPFAGAWPAGPRSQQSRNFGQEIWVYHGTGGTFTFWRFMIEVPLAENEMGGKQCQSHSE